MLSGTDDLKTLSLKTVFTLLETLQEIHFHIAVLFYNIYAKYRKAMKVQS